MNESPPLSPSHRSVCEPLARAFAHDGYQLYLVGGAARDLLLGRTSYDLDFTTDAHPAAIKPLLKRAGASDLFTVGERFGTIGGLFRTAGLTEVVSVEVTTFRSEAYQPYSRKPAVAFGTTLEGDLSRRDLTVNAMALDVSLSSSAPRLIDPFGGQSDLVAGVIRAVGDPNERFSEDPLRLLRAVRFATQLNFTIESDTAAAIQRQAGELSWVPNERIQPEISRVLLDERAGSGILQICDLGLMEHIVPEMLALRGMHEDSFRHKDVFDHTLKVIDGVPVDETLRWAALLHDIAKPRTRTIEHGEVHFHRHEIVGKHMARRILARLKYPRQIIDDVVTLVELHLRPNAYESSWTDGAVRRLMREAGPGLERLMLLSRADVTSRRVEKRVAADRRIDELAARCVTLQSEADVARLTSPLDGNELMTMFKLGPGPWIKPIKDHLTELVVDGALAPDDRGGATVIATEMFARLRTERTAKQSET